MAIVARNRACFWQAGKFLENMEEVETIEYKGKTIKIYADEDAMDPDEYSDNSAFLVHYHNDCWIKKDDIIEKEDLDRYFEGEKIEQAKEYHIFLVNAYIHGGVSLSLSRDKYPFTDAFDVSSCGAVLVSKKEIKTRKQARETAQGLIESWNDYLSGNIYGYQIDGGSIGSCWGFYGDIEKSGLIEQAKDDINVAIEAETKKHLKRLKAYITNHVPFSKRAAMIL